MVLVKVALVLKNRLAIFLKRLAIFQRPKKHSYRRKTTYYIAKIQKCIVVLLFQNDKVVNFLSCTQVIKMASYLLAFYLFYIFQLETTSQNASQKIRNFCTKMQNQDQTNRYYVSYKPDCVYVSDSVQDRKMENFLKMFVMIAQMMVFNSFLTIGV